MQKRKEKVEQSINSSANFCWPKENISKRPVGSLTIRGQIRCKTFILQEYESYLMGIKLEKSMKDFLHEFRIEKLEEYFPCYLLFIDSILHIDQ